MVKIPEMYNQQVIFLICLNFLLGAEGADKDVCSPCQMGKVKPSGKNIQPVAGSWRSHIQNLDGSKCYYPFENDGKSLQLQIKFINDELDFRSVVMDPTIHSPATMLKVKLVAESAKAGGWEPLLLNRDITDGGCSKFYELYNDKAVTALLGRPAFTDYTGKYDPGRREFWKVIDDKLNASPKLPIFAVYSNRIEEYKDLYRDKQSFCRYSTFSGPLSKFGACPNQYRCGLVDIPSLHPIMENMISLVGSTALRYVDPKDLILRKFFTDEDKKTSIKLSKELENIVGSKDWQLVRKNSHARMHLPCIHLNHEYRALVKRVLDKILKKIGAEKNTVNGLMRDFREILLIHLRVRRPQLRGLLADGTEFQFRQIGENCGCSVPFWKTLSHMAEIINAPSKYDDDGFQYNFKGLDDILEVTETNFYKSALASCDFGLNLECNDKCKCVCPEGALCNRAPRSRTLFSVTIYLLFLYIFNKAL